MLRKTHALFAAAVAFFIGLTPSQIIASSFFGIISDMDRAFGFRHRGFTHSLLFALLSFLVSSALFPNLAMPVLVGITTHIFADMLNPEGVELFYPSKKNYRIAKFRFNSKTGNGIVIAMSAALVILKLKGYSFNVEFLKSFAYAIHKYAYSFGLK